MTSKKKISLFWFRRDLRLEDNSALYHALKENKAVQCIFIFDREILDKLSDHRDARVSFIYDAISTLKKQLNEMGSDLWVLYGKPKQIWKDLIETNNIDNIYFNRDYESYALERDTWLKEYANTKSIELRTFKDHVIFEKDEILKSDGTPYTVFTPYKMKWLEKLHSSKLEKHYYLKSYPTEKYFSNLNSKTSISYGLLSLEKMGFKRSNIVIPTRKVTQKTIKEYSEKRNYPAIEGSSRLGIHFRFGTISIRKKARMSMKLSDVFLSELIWRDFYSQILAHFPYVEKSSFRSKYDRIEWRNNEDEFDAWRKGITGYPMVDAGMRELNTTGFMHNRIRMITASFLTKHLLIDWRWGEAYFAEKLLDYDLSSNNGGWQWAAGSGTDAAPYFRIFNPTSQQVKFDKEFQYIKEWIPEWGSDKYPSPIVDHKEARERCLSTYKMAVNEF